MSHYVLENEKEFVRLETQSRMPQYDFRVELGKMPKLKKGSHILDAGCGSGIVARYLSECFSSSEIVGVDGSELRVTQARKAAAGIANLTFRAGSLTKLDFADESFDLIVCRFVLEHMSAADQRGCLAEFTRCLKSGGTLIGIDLDGLLLGIHPQTPLMAASLKKLADQCPVDFQMGRKMPKLFLDAGLENIQTEIQPMLFEGDALKQEINNTRDRFSQARPILEKILGETTSDFEKQYIASLEAPGSILFYNKFVVQGRGKSLKKHLKVAAN